MESKKVSVIVPIYKVEKYIKCCIDSILNQTYKNLEIILVDDGSPDNCPKICDDYAEIDTRVRVIHKQNGGLSDARNAGIAVASGELFFFVDSDDSLELNTIHILIENLENTDSDISCCRYYRSDVQIDLNTNTNDLTILDNYEGLKDLFENKLQNVVTWNKLYKAYLFDGVCFPKGKICEDIFTIYKLLFRAKKIVKTSYIGNFYRDNPKSITKIFNANRLDAFEGYKECINFLVKNKLEVLTPLCARCALISIFRYNSETHDKTLRKIMKDYFFYFYNFYKNGNPKDYIFKIRIFLYRYVTFLSDISLILVSKFRKHNKYVIMG